jgi:preprotein translocase subunit SecG
MTAVRLLSTDVMVVVVLVVVVEVEVGRGGGAEGAEGGAGQAGMHTTYCILHTGASQSIAAIFV